MSFLINILIIFVACSPFILLALAYDRWAGNLKISPNDNGVKSVDIKRLFFWLGAIPLVLFGGVGAYVLMFTDEPWAGIGFIGMGSGFALLALPFLVKDTSVKWNDNYIEGTKSEWTFKKNRILWKDVSTIEVIPQKGVKIFDKNGNVAVFSFFHAGWHNIVNDLRRIRPDLDLSDLN